MSPCSGSKMFETDGIPERIFQKVDFEKNQETTKKTLKNYPEGEELKTMVVSYVPFSHKSAHIKSVKLAQRVFNQRSSLIKSYLSQQMRFWFLAQREPGKAQMSLY